MFSYTYAGYAYMYLYIYMRTVYIYVVALMSKVSRHRPRSPGTQIGMGAMPKSGAQVGPPMAWMPGAFRVATYPKKGDGQNQFALESCISGSSSSVFPPCCCHRFI